MKSGYRITLLVGVFAALVSLTMLSGTVAWALNEGDTAPSFRLPDLHGNGSFASDSLFAANGWSLLILWNTNCPDCMADVVKMGRHASRADSLPFHVVGIVNDDEKIGDARRLVKGTKLTFLNLWDASGSVAKAMSAGNLSFSCFLIDGKGVVHLVHYDHPESIDSIWTSALEIADAREAAETDDE